MSIFVTGDWVLIPNGRAGYELAQVQRQSEGGYQIIKGHYTTFYKEKDCHKPPRSIMAQLRAAEKKYS